MSRLSRRDFLRLAALAPAAAAFSKFEHNRLFSNTYGDKTLPSAIILVFDAMSARNLSLYGYPRRTTPNLERFAERATVYHAHHSAGNFTTPGVASLLTGMYPWTHRAINLGGLVARNRVKDNLFHLIGDDHRRLAFSQSNWADSLLNQFHVDLDIHRSPGAFGVIDGLVGERFKSDLSAAYRAYDDFLFQIGYPPGSLAFGMADRLYLSHRKAGLQTDDYPNGLPYSISYPIYFRIEDIFNGILSLLATEPLPCLAYFHMIPPHEPYIASRRYREMFNDGWSPTPKPRHWLGGKDTNTKLNRYRRHYDAYIANIDAEFSWFVGELDERGILDQSYLIITADHGEMFERGVRGHSTALLYEPVVHVPLVISAPGQRSRKDIYSPTNHVDILPTLLHLAGREIPAWCEGELLPGLGGQEDAGRVDFAIQAQNNPAFDPLVVVTMVMRRGKYKMIYYTGYEAEDAYELYDLESDSEELNDLYPAKPSIAVSMGEELLAKLEAVNRPYEAGG